MIHLSRTGIKICILLLILCTGTACHNQPNLNLHKTAMAMANHIEAKAVEIRLFRSYGNEGLVHIMARTIEPENLSVPQDGDSKWKNFLRNLKGITVDEIAGVHLRFDLNGQSVYGTSDAEGMIRIKTHDFGLLAPATYELTAQLTGDQAFAGHIAKAPLIIHSAQGQSLSVISDIDDTIKDSQVSDKWEAAKKLMLGNPLTAQAIKGTPELYRLLDLRLDQKADGDIFYLSGSPLNLSPQIYAFLDHQGFPIGSVDLKKWGFEDGDDNPLAQSAYKQERLREIFKTYPTKHFLLFGDSGEHDTEIYLEIAKEFPGRVQGIFINNVTGESPLNPRFSQVNLTQNTREAAQILKRMGLLTAEDLTQIP